MCPQAFVIAGTRSGCGKTSVSLGLMAALTRRGLQVQPFKTGPDFIDPGHHALACSSDSHNCVSHNLDTWMLPPDTVQEVFARHAHSSDMAVVEGVMGLFDGRSGTDEAGSTAALAKQLGLPVILVVDAKSMARSVAALVAGYAHFDPDLKLAGVILNNVSSPSHADILKQAMTLLPDVPVLGVLQRNEDIALPSRHLGLVTAKDPALAQDLYKNLADWVETGIDLDSFCEALPAVSLVPQADTPAPEPVARIGVARDAAFCFYYEENLRLLRQAGAELVEFSPTHDKKLPDNLDGLYFGGGYPELYGYELGQNTKLKKEIRACSESGMPIYAECGGFMYLLDALDTGTGIYKMVDIFPGRAVMSQRFKALGYREVELLENTILGPTGTLMRGHEFHYSSLESPMPDAIRATYRMTSRKGVMDHREGFCINNTLGTYVHLHFGSNPEVARNFVQRCAAEGKS